MTLKTYLFKPRWQHKDPALRAEAVAHDNEPELLAELAAICLDDEDAQVRMAAARRLRDLPALAESLRRARGPEEQRVLEERIRGLAASTGADRPPLEQRLALARATSDRVLLEQLARHAPEPELRRLAVGRVEQQGLLGDIAIHDENAEIRQSAAARIHQHSTLLRVIEATRKSDKQLHAALVDRLRAERLAAGDPRTVAEEAQRICVELEKLAVQQPSDTHTRRVPLATAWQAIADLVPAQLVQRHGTALARLDAPPETIAPAAHVTVPEAPDPPPAEAAPPEPPAAGPAAAVEPPAPPPPPPARATSVEFPARLEALFEELKAHLEAGELATALTVRAALLEAGKPFSGDPRWRRLHGRLGQLSGRLRELRDWQHWSNNTVRKQMIAELEALPTSGLHPDAVLARLQELQARWKELEHSEQIPGEKHFAAAPGLWRRFNAAGRQAFAATKPFLDKRSEVQQQLSEQLHAVAEGLKALSATETPDWMELRKAISQGAQGLRSLGDLPPRLRHKAGARLKRALDAANQRMRKHEDEVEQAKRALIRAAAQLQHLPQRAEAIASAKSLQSQWSASGSLRRKLEQQLWLEFRGHIDPLFAEVQAQQAALQQSRQQSREAQLALCRTLEEILSGEDGTLAGQQGRVRGLQDTWRDVRDPDPKLRTKFQALLSRFDERQRSLKRRAAHDEQERLWAKARTLHTLERQSAAGALAAEQLSQAQSAWPAAARTTELEARLDARLQALLDGRGPGGFVAADAERARMLAIQLEFLAGLPSPEADRQLRMKYQVDRLAQTLAGERPGESAQEEARHATEQWLLLGALPEDVHAGFEVRIRTALQELNRG